MGTKCRRCANEAEEGKTRCGPCRQKSRDRYLANREVLLVQANERERALDPTARRSQRKARKEAKQQVLLALLGGKCVGCGAIESRKDEEVEALHFHHRDPLTKAFTVSESLSRPLAVLKAEALKCDLLCRACHQEHHRLHPSPRLAQPGCPGPPPKLTLEQVRAVQQEYAQPKMVLGTLALKYGVSVSTIHRAVCTVLPPQQPLPPLS